MCNTTSGADSDVAGLAANVVLWLALDGCLFVFIVSGNLVTLYVLRSSMQFSPLVSNHFVMSLALSDTVVGLTIPYHMAMNLTPSMAANRVTCVLKFVFILFGCCASILNMTAIAADRYFAIVHPFKYERIMNARLAHVVLCGGWLHAVIFSTVPLYWNSWRPEQPCELGRVLPRYYTTAVITPAFAIIWAIMFTIYWRIWREAVNQANKMRRQHVNICKLRQSCFQVVLLIMGCFTFCWFPFLAVACIQAAGHPDLISPTMYKVVLSVAISSSAVNPLIYAWKNAEFKRTFGHMLRCRTASHSLQYERSSEKQNRNSLFIEIQTNRNSGLFQELQQL
ncbi:D(1) dopamine receptor-like [Macrosteles quadrilineatus]|uniref:D(1) dopamine receptor-like n=1 Tax=Macrosteles quadrilineatus TaxID=74068 RepID=UPI0023E15B00|nr:D(1) dopamine receptor-like [Macrosteles quadrilineatus]XP_054288321.1 D(1) dopamine receptor-like [Macrosteles quadrilineatus]XP_054288322.1 D(1) dopamine receptor-like [Macrosteles quadrilineatus]